ncbi:MAG TPA: serine/threonine-protein kinase [Nannocystaceae bacterium]|nr:serine/threonine-protein kinase [Nannocystaceae bacterium]
MVGTSLLGRYLIEDVLGEGGSSSIYRGVHTTIGRTVAIKMLRPELVRNEETVARFLREGRAACRVRHEHVVEATDFGVTPEGDVFLVMEYLEGEDLASLLEREGPLPWPRARAIALQICEAIEAAHDAGVIHRDITLQNCFRVHRDRNPDYIKVIDFGIAKMLEPTAPATDECGVTGNAEIFGTPEYMAPEQVRRTIDADVRSDVYALGAMLYALVTGRLPLRGATALDTLVRQIYEDVVPPSTFVTGVPPQLEAAILRALAKDPDARFQSMAEFAAALERVPVLGLVDRRAPVGTARPAAVVIEGPVTETDLDLPDLAEHDLRSERPAERLLGRAGRSWTDLRWPLAAVAALALVVMGARMIGSDADAPAQPPSVRASALVEPLAPAPQRVAVTPSPAPIEAAPVPPPPSVTAVAVADETTAPPPKVGRSSSRRGTPRRAEPDAALEPWDGGASIVDVEADTAEAGNTDEVVDFAVVEEAPATAAAPPAAATEEPSADVAADVTVPQAPTPDPTPDPFASPGAADEIKDPFSAPR